VLALEGNATLGGLAEQEPKEAIHFGHPCPNLHNTTLN